MGRLPGGYWDGAGRLHRTFELAGLTGREEELLADAAPAHTAALVTQVLSRALRSLGTLSPVPPEVTRELLVADRHYLLLQLRSAAFGDLVRAELVCPWPECGERISLDFSAAALPVREARVLAPEHTMTLSGTGDPGTEVVFRLPDGSDQEALAGPLAAGERTEPQVLTALLARCVRRLGDRTPPDEEALAGLPARHRAEIEARMTYLAPSVARTMEAGCPECGRTVLAPFDIERFFFGDLRADAALLYQEVHYLAYHYHWSEAELLELPREKRRRYIGVLAETIEVLNGGT